MEHTVVQENAATGRHEIWRESFSSHIRWGAVFGGWLTATAIAMLLYAVGVSIGIGTISAADAEVFSKKVVFLSAAWMLVTWMTALFFGGYFASAASRDTNQRGAVSQAVLVWALSNILTLLVGVTGIGATGMTGALAAGEAAGGLGAGLTASAPLVASQAAAENRESTLRGFQADLRRSLSVAAAGPNAREVDAEAIRQAAEDVDARELASLTTAFLRGDEAAARDSLTVYTSLSPQQIDRVVATLSSRVEEAKARLEAASDKAAAYTVAALWTAVLTSVLALLAAIAGAKQRARLAERQAAYGL